MSQPPATFRLEDFQFQTDFADADGVDWSTRAVRALVAAAGVDGFVVPMNAAGTWGKVDRAKRVGVNIVGVKAGCLLASYAAFDASGAPCAWSSDLNPGNLTKRSAPAFALYADEAKAKAGYDATSATRRDFIKVDAALKRRLAPAAKAKPATSAMTHEGDILALAASPDGRYLVSTGHDGAICIWDSSTGAQLHRITSAGGRGMQFLHAVAFSPDSKSVIGGARALKRFDLATGELLVEYAGHPKGEVVDVQVSPKGKYIASVSTSAVKGGDNTVALWDAKTGKQLGNWAHGNHAGGPIARFQTDEKRLLVAMEGDEGNELIELAVPSMKLLKREPHEWSDETSERTGYKESDTSPDGRLRVFADEVVAGKKRKKLDADGAVDKTMFFTSPDGLRIAGVVDDRRLGVWDPATGKRLLPRA
ncbi:WD domain-containing protein, G-beta repeat-containing protein [Nannocystis exedens]|uniref:WD domain-containing protein, G-beta repeat-containing protein n=1 Tax=Nannocystis exedens TaxID=54 RepID=A0A1I2I8S5_9BACT|nr:WD40 repeat domain-containing protein [Nannocystis exedens]PCC73565.1 High-affinity carbon uptake protein Hat/HatR [Nannocystis exedens]SFF37507.1 WD domain-containing protein, G-beta repeat-containing protein [Nannocystis exedens]